MWRIGVDVGGTFTDVAAVEQRTGRTWVRKLPTTPDDRAVVVVAGIRTALDELGLEPHDVAFLAHGTTVGTNALIERKGASTALITTDGFRDVLEFRRMNKVGILDPYDFNVSPPAPLIPRERRYGLVERTGAAGEEVVAVDRDSLDATLRQLQDDDISAVAIALLFSFKNPAHEREVADAVRKALPDVFVTCSSDIDPQQLEYERTSTTAVNAYLGPPVRAYLRSVAAVAVEEGLPPLRVMRSNGGLVSVDSACDVPASLLESGPAAGMISAAKLAESRGLGDLIVVDMGGTSFDVGVVRSGAPEKSSAVEFEGFAVRLPMLDIRSIGAGGGSIAEVGPTGTLTVGPRSAGAQPGPVCYGRGGAEPTTTDADAVLGYFADDCLGLGAFPLDRAAAADAVEEAIGRPLGMSAEQAAAGIVSVVDANMANAIRAMVTFRGLDPRDFALVAGGGAGPLHAGRLATELGIERVVVPPHPGALSAVGLTQADMVHEAAATVGLLLVDLDAAAEALERTVEELVARLAAGFANDGIDFADVEVAHFLDLQYYGQSFQVVTPLGSPIGAETLRECVDAFHDLHLDQNGVSDPTEIVYALTCRSVGTARTGSPPLLAGAATGASPVHRSQPAWFPELGGWADARIVARTALAVGEVVDGPALIPQGDSATLVLPCHRAVVLDDGSLLLEVHP